MTEDATPISFLDWLKDESLGLTYELPSLQQEQMKIFDDPSMSLLNKQPKEKEISTKYEILKKVLSKVSSKQHIEHVSK